MRCGCRLCDVLSTAWKVSKYGVLPDANAGKYGPE